MFNQKFCHHMFRKQKKLQTFHISLRSRTNFRGNDIFLFWSPTNFHGKYDTFQELFQRDWIQSRGISQWQSSDSDYILNEMARLFDNKTLSNVKIQRQKMAHFLQEPIRSQHFVFGVRFSLRASHIPNFGTARAKHSKKKGKRWIWSRIYFFKHSRRFF